MAYKCARCGQRAFIVLAPGAGHFELQRDADLDATFARVAEELRHQYQLGFSPAVLDGKVHQLEVRVTTPGQSSSGDLAAVSFTWARDSAAAPTSSGRRFTPC